MPKEEILLQINNEQQLYELCQRIVDSLYDNGSVTRQGCYGLSKSQTFWAIYESILGNKNPLPELDSLTYLSWDAEKNDDVSLNYANKKDIKLWKKALQEENYWNIYAIFDQDSINSIDSYVTRVTHHQKELKEYSHRRKQASIYTSNRKVRERILKKYDHKCVVCGRKKNLTIDHIIPVLLGGSNDEKNLQVLCRSCNSSKGCRKGVKK